MTEDELRREGAVIALRHCADIMEKGDRMLSIDASDPRAATLEIRYLRARANNIEAGTEGIK